MDIKPMTAEEISAALISAEDNLGVHAVLALLRGLELQANDRIIPGQPELDRRDFSTIVYAHQDAQETILDVIEKAKKVNKTSAASPS